jgi:hypothetical protein
LQLLLFVRTGAIEGAQRVLDALQSADRIVGVDVACVGSSAPDQPSFTQGLKSSRAQHWRALSGIPASGRFTVQQG